MMKTTNVAVIVGSLREGSLNRKAAKALADLAPDGMRFSFISIGDLPLYNEDLDTEEPPSAWARFRQEMKQMDAVLFATPEYNRSISGVIKNAIDVGSRPYGQSIWSGKPAAVISVSPGAIGGFGANHHLRQSLVFLDMPVMQQPEAYIGNAREMFANDGPLRDEGTRKFFKQIVETFADWIERVATDG